MTVVTLPTRPFLLGKFAATTNLVVYQQFFSWLKHLNKCLLSSLGTDSSRLQPRTWDVKEKEVCTASGEKNVFRIQLFLLVLKDSLIARFDRRTAIYLLFLPRGLCTLDELWKFPTPFSWSHFQRIPWNWTPGFWYQILSSTKITAYPTEHVLIFEPPKMLIDLRIWNFEMSGRAVVGVSNSKILCPVRRRSKSVYFLCSSV